MVDQEQIEEGDNEVVNGYNADDRSSVNNARKRAARKETERMEVVRGIMSVREGRAWMYDYLSRCGTFTSPFIPGQREQTDFNCGKQHVGHLIQEDIMKASPQQYWKMITEAADDK